LRNQPTSMDYVVLDHVQIVKLANVAVL